MMTVRFQSASGRAARCAAMGTVARNDSDTWLTIVGITSTPPTGGDSFSGAPDPASLEPERDWATAHTTVDGANLGSSPR